MNKDALRNAIFDALVGRDCTNLNTAHDVADNAHGAVCEVLRKKAASSQVSEPQPELPDLEYLRWRAPDAT